MPWTDWQFWVVTTAAGCSLWVLLRPFLKQQQEGPGCGSCASGAAACARPRLEGEENATSKLVVLGGRGIQHLE